MPDYRAIRVNVLPDGNIDRTIATCSTDDLPPGEVLIRVYYSSLNYKDALSATGNKGVTRRFPHTPGIDAAGVVETSSDPEFGPGDPVIVIGYDLGMNTPGGWGEYIRVPGNWVAKLPPGMTLYESMILGTAGFTAAQALDTLQTQGNMAPGTGEVLVTGATGGVGSIAVALLGKLGYTVVAATGKVDESPFLLALGAHEVVHRDELLDASGRPLLKERWAGAIDTTGGAPLANILKSLRQGCSVAACGLVASPALETTVYPFILRGVNLLGIDSVNVPIERRRRIWGLLATTWQLPVMEHISREVGLEALDREIDRILQGRQVGRVVVAHR